VLEGQLARLYTNGILDRVLSDVCGAAIILPEPTSMTQSTIRLTVNGRVHEVGAAPDTALLYVCATISN